MTLLLVFMIILAQGKGILVTQKDVAPYKRAFYQVYGHYPKSYEEKEEVLMNCLSDKLILKRADDLKVDRNPEFLREWNEMKAYIDKKCRVEKIERSRCEAIKDRFFQIAKMRFVLRKEVLPVAEKKASEKEWLVETHESLKGKVPENKITGYIKDVSRLEALNAYVKKLMKLYKVKINKKALRSL